MAADIAQPPAKQFIAALLLSSLLLCSGSRGAAAQEIAFAFTDTLSQDSGLDGLARAKMLVNSLKRIDIPPSMFLIRTADINSRTIAQMAFYEEAGQLLVNAGHNASPLSRKTEHYLRTDLAKANRILSQYTHYHRHIYLGPLYESGYGDIASGLQQYLSAYNYQPLYTTYSAQDNYLDQLYQAQLAAGKSVNLESLKKAYVNLVINDISAYSAQARLLLGYYPRQVILLHATDLTAYTVVDLADALNQKGFTIISPEKIFSDPVANPFFAAGYSATGYMQAITGLSEPKRSNLYLPSAADKEKIHTYLIAQGLDNLTREKMPYER